MTDIVEKYGILGDEQFGFRRKRSTLDAIFVLSRLLQKAKKKGQKYAAAFLDISKVIPIVNITYKNIKIEVSPNGVRI